MCAVAFDTGEPGYIRRRSNCAWPEGLGRGISCDDGHFPAPRIGSEHLSQRLIGNAGMPILSGYEEFTHAALDIAAAPA